MQNLRDHIDLMYGSPLGIVSDILRGVLISKEGHDLIAADFSSIEARVIAWLSGEEEVLNIFRGHGMIYEHAAASIYKVPMEEVTKEQRQIGKTAVLALGYQGGVGAFQTMAKAFNIKVSDEEAEVIKINWRASHRNIVSYWYELEECAKKAVLNAGATLSAGPEENRTKFKMAGSFLWCQLPSERVLCYPYPKVEEIDTPWGEKKMALTYMGESTFSRKWERQKTYGGKLCENITQAVARDLLAEAMIRLENHGYPVVMHVHDEIVCEVFEDFGSVEEMEKIMTQLPEWGQGLPIAASGWRAKRFQK